jgi:carboxyl-terminal processing protease
MENTTSKKWINGIRNFFLILFAAFSISFIANAFQPEGDEVNFEMGKNMELFGSVYKELHMYYVDEIEPGNLMQIGMDAMLESLDPYTVYIPESQIEDFRFQTTGQYGGIGALIRKEGDFVMITDPYKNYPAQKEGLRAGDIIIAIDGKSIKGKASDEVSSLLKGSPGTTLKIKFTRPGSTEEMEKTLTREEVKIPSVPFYDMIDAETGYIKFTQFTSNSADDVKRAFKALKEKGMKKLIFDLRDNGGGLLNEAVDIVNMFVPKGTEIVRQKGKVSSMNFNYKGNNDPNDLNIPIAVLVNGMSASASEIVAGGLQDLDRAIIVGQRSYGKGLVQQTKSLPYGAMIKLTVAKYYTPSGRCIQKLDYTHKQEGKAVAMADSLIQKFKTKNGREVFDGRGIDPEIFIPEKEYSQITTALFAQDLIFDYATNYRIKNETIADARNFNFTDAMYDDFLVFLKDKEYSYSTATMKEYETLKKIAEKEKYAEGAQAEFDALLKKISPDKNEDLKRFKEEITWFLENEIISRYYYEDGRIEMSLVNDPFIIEAKKVLDDKSRYDAILKGTAK